MAVCNLKSPDDWTRETFSGDPAHCFFCGKQVDDVAVIWKGHAWTATACALVVLHPHCGRALGIEFIGDARNAERLLNGKSILEGIDRSLLPQGTA